ncbi:MAG: carboxypeptidase-like regulatory domain-containing protein, partial [Acidobacteriota bacterium]|nr:carboxypeptidase-like regulatory domain-containing protein [Acidobacteriota bacterium]
MRKIISSMIAIVAVLALVSPVSAQQTTGTVTGRITDAQQAAVPGVTVTATNTATGFSRSDVTTSEGLYRIAALPVGTYDIKAELQGFKATEQK